MLLLEMKNTNSSTSTSNANTSSTYTLPPLCPPPIIYRNHPHGIQSCHAIDKSASEGLRASLSNSNFLSAVKLSTEDYSCAAPETIPPFYNPLCTPGDLNSSTYSRASSLTSSHQPARESSPVHFVSQSHSLLLPMSMDCIPISTSQTRANFYNLNIAGSNIDSIHTAVLSSSHILDDDYLIRISDILKHPHKKERA